MNLTFVLVYFGVDIAGRTMGITTLVLSDFIFAIVDFVATGTPLLGFADIVLIRSYFA